MTINFSVQSLQFSRARNSAGKKTMRYVWDIVSREDSPARMLIETWGGKPDGYIRCFPTDLLLGNYLSGRIAKGSEGAMDSDIDLSLVGAEDYTVVGPLTNLGKALTADNHEKAKIRLRIGGAKDDWDSDACLNNTLMGIVNYGENITCDELNQAMASRIKKTFKRGGDYAKHIREINEFMISGTAADELADVLGTEKMTYPPMDRDRITEVVSMADDMREKMTASRPEVKEPDPEIHIPEPVIERGSEWGGWA